MKQIVVWNFLDLSFTKNLSLFSSTFSPGLQVSSSRFPPKKYQKLNFDYLFRALQINRLSKSLPIYYFLFASKNHKYCSIMWLYNINKAFKFILIRSKDFRIQEADYRHLLVYWFSIMISAMFNILQVAANITWNLVGRIIENLKLHKNVAESDFDLELFYFSLFYFRFFH